MPKPAFEASVNISFCVPWGEDVLLVAHFDGLTTIPRVISSSDSRGLVCPEALDISNEF